MNKMCACQMGNVDWRAGVWATCLQCCCLHWDRHEQATVQSCFVMGFCGKREDLQEESVSMDVIRPLFPQTFVCTEPQNKIKMEISSLLGKKVINMIIAWVLFFSHLEMQPQWSSVYVSPSVIQFNASIENIPPHYFCIVTGVTLKIHRQAFII